VYPIFNFVHKSSFLCGQLQLVYLWKVIAKFPLTHAQRGSSGQARISRLSSLIASLSVVLCPMFISLCKIYWRSQLK